MVMHDSSQEFNPEMDYYKNYGQSAERRLDYSLAQAMSVISLEAEKTLYEHYTTDSNNSNNTIAPIDVRRALARYKNSVRFEVDLTRKRAMVDKLEMYKARYDEDNIEDAESAEFHLRLARTADPRVHAMETRIRAYQTAIAHTNNLNEKNKLRLEYRRFCFSQQQKK